MNWKSIIKENKLYYDFLKRRSANETMQNIKSEKSNVLTNEQKKNIKNYFKKYIKVNTKSHNFYMQKTGNYYVNYLPEDMYLYYIDGFYNDWRIAFVIDNKCYYKRLLPNIKQPGTVANRINNMWFDDDMKPITIKEVENKLKEYDELFIKKASETFGGFGVFVLKNDESMIKNFYKIIKNISNDLIIQLPVKQSKVLSKINESSVNSIRVLSFLDRDGTVKIYSSVLRMGVAGARVDNASSGGLTCGINDDGTLKNVAFNRKGEKFYKHPTSGIEFKKVKIPSFEEMKRIIKVNHPFIPTSRLISWDFAIDDSNEVVLLEVNLKNGGIRIHQLNNGPLFGDDTEKILEEVFHKK